MPDNKTPKTNKNTATPPGAAPTSTKLVANTTVVYKDPDSGTDINFTAGDVVKGLSSKHVKALEKYLDKV